MKEFSSFVRSLNHQSEIMTEAMHVTMFRCIHQFILSMLSFSLLYSSVVVDFASPSGRSVPSVMVFPVALSGAPVVVTVDWCRGCQQGDVPTVRATGKKGKPYWDPHLKLLKPQERGDPSVAAQDPAELKAPDPYEPESKAQEPDFTRCKHPECYANWKKARHYSGYCSLSCALASGWVEDGHDSARCKHPECYANWRKAKHYSGYCSLSCALASGWVEDGDAFARCKHPECHANWRKAKHYSGYCSLSCALASGWVEDVTEKRMKKAKYSSSGVVVPPPHSMSAEISQEIFADEMVANKMVHCRMDQDIERKDAADVEAVQAKSDNHGLKRRLDFADEMMANKMVRCQMELYIARNKGTDVEAVQAKNDKRGLGYTKKGLDFFNKDSRAGSIVFVSAGILQ